MKKSISRISKKLPCNGKVLIGADFVPTESNREIFRLGMCDELFGQDLYVYLKSVDYRIFNLETPITEQNEKIRKEGSPNLKTYPEAVNLFKKLSPALFSGANNHILDYGELGIKDTIKYLNKVNLEYVGFGISDHIKKIHYFKCENTRVGVYSLAENEYSVNKAHNYGANGFDVYDTFDEISLYKEQCDFLIVLFHGGCENYRYPTPEQKKKCRKFVDKGADLVVCQHSHCVGAFEVFQNSTIIYGQGNFLFDRLNIEEWKTSILIELDFHDSTINIIPILKESNKIRMAEYEIANEIIDGFEKRSAQINNSDFMEKKWEEFVESQKNVLLLRGIMGINSPIIMGLNKMTNGLLGKLLFTTKHKILLLNYIKCESIRERIIYLLQK